MSAPLCVGKWQLFDSTDPGDHDQAAKICASCDLRACQGLIGISRERERVVGETVLVGTWAGRLYGQGPAKPGRIAAEDAMFSDDDARVAHAAWVRGERNDRTRIGERVYQRRSSQRLRARRAA